MKSKRVGGMRATGVAAMLAVVLAALVGAAPSGAATKSINEYLGAAGPFGPGAPWAMISLGDFKAKGPGADNGNVAVAAGKAKVEKSFAINGKVYLGQDVSYKSDTLPTGGVISDPALVSKAANDALAATDAFENLAPTQTFDTLGDNTTLTAAGPGSFNVVSVSGVKLTKGTLTLSGDSTSVFVVNVDGDLKAGDGGGVVLAGGLRAANVVWNLEGNLNITSGHAGGGTFYGTALVVDGSVKMHGGTWNGEIVGGKIEADGATVNALPAATPLSVFVAYADNAHGAATFGNTGIGAFVDNGMFSNFKIVHRATLTTSGSVRKLSVYAVPGVNSPSPQLLKAVIYADAGGAPGALVATGAQVTYRGAVNGAGWFDLPFAVPVPLAAGTYWIGFITGDVTEGMGYAYDVVPNSRAYNANAYASGPTNPFGPATEDSEQASIYATLTNPNAFPHPWRGTPGVTFAGCGYGGADNCPQIRGGDIYDAGAIRVDVPAGASGPVTVTGASVQIGPCSYNPWPGLHVTIQPGRTLILTQTGRTPRCTSSASGEENNFDTSDSFLASPQYQQFLQNGTCTSDGYVPVITLTINGASTVVTDSRQVLNTRGIDPGLCSGRAEAIGWRQIR